MDFNSIIKKLFYKKKKSYTLDKVDFYNQEDNYYQEENVEDTFYDPYLKQSNKSNKRKEPLYENIVPEEYNDDFFGEGKSKPLDNNQNQNDIYEAISVNNNERYDYGLDSIEEMDKIRDGNKWKIKIKLPRVRISLKKVNLKTIIPIGLGIITILGVGIFCLFYFSSTGSLNEIEVNIPDIIYLGERTTINAKGIGNGNLRKTRFQYEVSDSTMVELENITELKGSKVSNNLVPITTGRFSLVVSAILENQEVNPVEGEIIVCKKLKSGVLQNTNITMGVNVTEEVNIDLGTETECYENLKYQVSDLTIATVDENGRIVAKKKGTTNLTISRGSDFVTAKITVIDSVIAVSGIKVSKGSVSLEVGSTNQITVTISPSNATNKNVTWTSSNSKVATVSNTGVIKGIAAGTATITVQDASGKFSAKVSVTVKKKETSSNSSNNSSNTSAPSISVARMYSNNSFNNGYARKGERVSLAITFNQAVSKPTVKIAGINASVSGSGKNYTATITVPSNLGDGAVSISISNYKNSSGKTGSTKTSLTGGNQKVIVDNTKPRCTFAVSGKQITITGIDKYGISGYVINQSSSSPSSGYTSSRVKTVPNAGIYYGHVRDKAGNIGTACRGTVY